MKRLTDEEKIRMLVRETLIQESFFSDVWSGIKTGVGKAYDATANIVGFNKPQGGLLGIIDRLNSEEDENTGSIEKREDEEKRKSYSSPLTGIMASSGFLSALVIGDSQAGTSLGKEIAGRLESRGLSTKIISEAGRKGEEVANRLESEIKGFNIVVAMFGGNDDNPTDTMSASDEMYKICQKENAYLILIGPPPATQILDVPLARRIFGDFIIDENSHLTRDGGRYAEIRVDNAEAIDEFSKGKPGISGFGIASRIPLDQYPKQPDGIHCKEGAEEISDKILKEINIDRIIDEIKNEKTKEETKYIPAVISAPVSSGTHPVTDLIRSRTTMEFNSSHYQIMEIIESVLQSEGFTQMAIVAAIANAWHESKLRPGVINHDEGRGRKSVGLFQLLDTGAGKGMSISERQDPVINTRKIADSAKKTEFMRYMREYPDDPRVLSAAFVVLVERPKRWATSRYNRAVTAGNLVGIKGPLPSVIGSINLVRRNSRKKRN